MRGSVSSFLLVAFSIASLLVLLIHNWQLGGPVQLLTRLVGEVSSPRLATARMFHTATLLNNGSVLIAGGVDGFRYHPLISAEVYNSATAEFQAAGRLNTLRIFDTATLLTDGRVLVTGGCDSHWNGIASAELFDPTSENFTPTGSLKTGRCGHTATLLKNKEVLIVGGRSDSSGGAITDAAAEAELYNPTTGAFIPGVSLKTGRDAHTATLLKSGQVLIVGGIDGSGRTLGSAELYDPATGAFVPTGSLKTERAAHTATLLNDGTVLIAGGYDNSANAVASQEPGASP